MIPVHIDIQQSINTFGDGKYQFTLDKVTVRKHRPDLDRYWKIIDDTGAEVLIETGTKWGGSALWFESIGLQVVTVDAVGRFSHDLRRHLTHKARGGIGRDIEFLFGASSTDQVMFDQVQKLVHGRFAGRRVMVSLDSDHHYDHVRKEIALYGPLVTPGCYLVVEDGIFDLMGSKGSLGGKRIPTEGGPLKAIEDALIDSGQQEFERDHDIEKLSPTSHHPAGWWKRVR